MHKFRKQKLTFSGTCSNRTIAAKIGLVVPGKMARLLCDKLQEIKEEYGHFERSFLKNEAQNCKLPLDINIAFS